MNVFDLFTQRVGGAVKALAADGVLASPPNLTRIVVEPPREAAHGDMATNAAMVLAKDAGKKPRELAEAHRREAARRRPGGEGRGRRAGLHQPHAQARGLARRCAPCSAPAPTTGAAGCGQGEPVNVEYVSANPTGPMHVGHCRGAVFGDALANLLAFAGFEVTREYYINDAGAQVDVLARSAFLRYREALGEDDRRDPGGALSRRLSQAGRRGARRRVRPRRC